MKNNAVFNFTLSGLLLMSAIFSIQSASVVLQGVAVLSIEKHLITSLIFFAPVLLIYSAFHPQKIKQGKAVLVASLFYALPIITFAILPAKDYQLSDMVTQLLPLFYYLLGTGMIISHARQSGVSDERLSFSRI